MKYIDKAPWLTSIESETESHIQTAISHFQNLTEDALAQPLKTGGWSIAQCLEHLNTYGDYYLPRLRESLQLAVHRPDTGTYARSILGSYLIKMTDPQSKSSKLKAVAKHLPQGLVPAHQIVADFIDQQEDLLLLIRQARHTEINAIKIPLSLTSWVRLSVGEILHFMTVHTARHIAQANGGIRL